MRYSRFAKYCSIATFFGILVVCCIVAALSSLGIYLLVSGVVCAAIFACVSYALVWLIWSMNRENLSKKGIRW